MSARRVRHDPTGLVDLLDTINGTEHAAVRAEVFAGGAGEDLVLVRCRCGRLFDSSVLDDHLQDPEAPRSSARRLERVTPATAARH